MTTSTSFFPAMWLSLAVMVVAIAFVFLRSWMRDRHEDRYVRRKQSEHEVERIAAKTQRIRIQTDLELERSKKQQELEEERLKREQEIRDDEHYRRMEEAAAAEKVAQAAAAGGGSGGYIIIDMSEKERPVFHDLLKGFEDYAKLRGYQLAFSIDSSFDGRIAFKFTVQDSGVIIGPERVRKDFHDYLERVRAGNVEEFDNLPVITSLEEHTLLVTLLKNRISFLQHSYTLSQNAVQYYELLLSQARTFPAVPTQNVVVHTGGSMSSRNYNANNASRLIQGERNAFTDSSENINIGQSFNEKNDRISQLDALIKHLEKVETEDEPARKAGRELSKVKDELAEAETPDSSAIARWMRRAKDLLSTAKIGAEVAEAAHKLYETFGL